MAAKLSKVAPSITLANSINGEALPKFGHINMHKQPRLVVNGCSLITTHDINELIFLHNNFNGS
jgi:hypothetical protein